MSVFYTVVMVGFISGTLSCSRLVIINCYFQLLVQYVVLMAVLILVFSDLDSALIRSVSWYTICL